MADWTPLTEQQPAEDEEVIFFCPEDRAQLLAKQQFIGYIWMTGAARATHWMRKPADPDGVAPSHGTTLPRHTPAPDSVKEQNND